MIWYCEECGEPVFNGEYGKDEHADIYGEYFRGCGRCENCDNDFCAEHFDCESGLCNDCLKKQEAEDDDL